MHTLKSLLLLSLVSSSALAETLCQKFIDVEPPISLSEYSADKQREKLWTMIQAEEYQKLPPLDLKERVLNVNPSRTHKELMELRIRAFEVKGDVRPVHDHKMTHINGPAALAKVVLKQNPFSGMFTSGERKALIRTSFAFNPKDPMKAHDFPQPGLAVKFFVDRQPSLNVLAMGSLDGEGENHHFFSTEMRTKLNRAETPRGKLGELIFQASTVNPGHLKLDHLAKTSPNGQKVSPIIPEWISFSPTPEALKFAAGSDLDFRKGLLGIPPGTRIYNIRGYLKNSASTVQEIDLGYMETETRFIASSFADRKLHFRHEGAAPSAAFIDFIRWHCGE